VKTNGALLCWGRGDQGQVGNGSTSSAQSPVTVIASGVAKVDVNGQHSCAVLTNGEVRCWGLNTSYQLGDGTTTRRTTPTAVPGVTDAVDVAVGQDFSCILSSGGAVRCWGANIYGSLGDGTSSTRTSPVTVTGLSSGVASITAVMSHACAVTTDGAAKCWGRNSQGQLGDGTITNRFTPVDVIGLSSGVDRIVTGAAANSTGNTCALLTSGSLKCWGYNNRGQLGTGDVTNSTTPVSVTVFGSAQAVSMAGNHACAIAAGGSTKCWGSNDFGQLGDGTVSTYNTSSVPVTGLTGNEGFPAEVTVTITASSGQSVAATVNLELN
jgi:alpha-tubulin suppressor-like RCC1 family protein